MNSIPSYSTISTTSTRSQASSNATEARRLEPELGPQQPDPVRAACSCCEGVPWGTGGGREEAAAEHASAAALQQLATRARRMQRKVRWLNLHAVTPSRPVPSRPSVRPSVRPCVLCARLLRPACLPATERALAMIIKSVATSVVHARTH